MHCLVSRRVQSRFFLNCFTDSSVLESGRVVSEVNLARVLPMPSWGGSFLDELVAATRALIRFCYTGAVHLTHSTWAPVLGLADALCMPHLADAVVGHLERTSFESNSVAHAVVDAHVDKQPSSAGIAKPDTADCSSGDVRSRQVEQEKDDGTMLDVQHFAQTMQLVHVFVSDAHKPAVLRW